MATYSQTPTAAGGVVEQGDAIINTLTLGATRITDWLDVYPDNIRIPTGQFRRVTVHIMDTDGNPIPEAQWVRSGGLFPTSGRVKVMPDGSTLANLWLLPAEYDNFVCTALDGPIEYVWEEVPGPDGETGIDLSTDEVTAVFDREYKRGLQVGANPSLGGMLK